MALPLGLPVNTSEEVQIARYIVLATTGAWIWDVLMSLADDVRTYTTTKLKPPDVGHLASRVASACFISISLAFSVAPVQNCNSLAKAVGWTGAITLPLHSIPFFFCARAIFFSQRNVLAIFGVLLLGTLGANLATPFFIHGSRLDDTSSCVVQLGRKYATGMVSIALHNTLVFVSVSIHLMMFTHADTWSGRLKEYLCGRGISQLSRYLMESGQSFILPMVIFNIAAATVNLIPTVPASYKMAFIVMNVALQNAMTARIHRLIKSGIIPDHPTTMNATTTLEPAMLDYRASRLPASMIDGSYDQERGGYTETHSAGLSLPVYDLNSAEAKLRMP